MNIIKDDTLFNSTSPEKDNEKLFSDESEDIEKKDSDSEDITRKYWKILVVDDEEDIHSVTRIALKGFAYHNKEIQFIHTYSAIESKPVIRENKDIAVILLDVVMETTTAGLDLVKYIREELNNRFTQVILRTGYPGYAPEREVIESYEINDYKTKTELTSFKLFTLILASLRAYDSITSLEKLRSGLEDKVKERTIELEKKNQNIIQSIQYASRIQNAILPSYSQFDGYFSDYFILNKPKEHVSGDFCWVNTIDGKLIFTIADCTGHGVPGALMSILGVMLLERITCVDKVIQTDEILNILRNRVNSTIRQKSIGEKLKDSIDPILCIFDPAQKTLQVSGAAGRIYYIRDNTLNILESSQLLCDSDMDIDIPFRKYEIIVSPGDVFYIFTDGYADQFGGEKLRRFTLKQFQDLLMEIYQMKMDKQKQILDDTIKNWQGSLEQIDDITVMGIRF